MKSSWFWKEADGHKRPTALLEWGLVLLSVLLLWAGWPGRGWPGLLFLAFTPLLALAEYLYNGGYRRPGRRLMGRVYLALLLWNLICTGWVGFATLPGMLAMVAINALLMLIPWRLYAWFKKVKPQRALLIGLLAWISLEYLHMHWELAWPWLNLGFGFGNYPGWVQWYDYTGILGGTLWILLANGAFYMVFWRHGAILQGQVRWLSLTYALLFVIGLPLLLSIWRGNAFEAEGKPVEVVLVQPNEDPYSNILISHPEKVGLLAKTDQLVSLTDSLITQNTRWVLWPESALPGFVWEYNPAGNQTLQTLYHWQSQYPNLEVVVGATTGTLVTDTTASRPTIRQRRSTNERYEAHNSAIWLSHGRAPEFYHKSVLVPAIETLPFASVLGPIVGPILESAGGVASGFAPQDSAEVFWTKDSLALAPSVCYESIFGDHTREFVNKGAQAIGVITNDAWWAESPGHRQHFAYARLLAVSLRRPVLRAANTGISGFIDAHGRVKQKTVFYTETALRDTMIFSEYKSVYAQRGDILGTTAAWLLVALLASALVQRSTQRHKA